MPLALSGLRSRDTKAKPPIRRTCLIHYEVQRKRERYASGIDLAGLVFVGLGSAILVLILLIELHRLGWLADGLR